MALGLGSLKQTDAAHHAKSDKKGNHELDNAQAAQLLKKMDAKAAAGICPFC